MNSCNAYGEYFIIRQFNMSQRERKPSANPKSRIACKQTVPANQFVFVVA